MAWNDVQLEATARIEITVEGKTYFTAGPIVRLQNSREPIEQPGPSGFLEFKPGPYEDITLTFRAYEMEKGEL